MNQPVFRRRHLPHWDVPDGIYFVTSCLAGSIPAQGLLDARKYETELEQRVRPDELTSEEWEVRKSKLVFARYDDLLDSEPAARHLADANLAQIVANALCFFAGVRYDLLAYCVMPSHFHWVFRPRIEWVAQLEKADNDQRTPRERIMHSIKRFTANECNKLLKKRGPFWEQESYDHWVRDLDELDRIIAYVELNPVKAGLVSLPHEWSYSSARDRKERNLEKGRPLFRL